MKKKEIPKISDAEWKVVELLWKSSPKTSFEIIDSLEEGNDWSPKTIKTLLFRLVKKGALGYEKKRREYSYFPLVKKEDYIAAESEGFLQKLFNGATGPMIAHFVKEKKMSSKEIEEIKSLLDEISQERAM